MRFPVKYTQNVSDPAQSAERLQERGEENEMEKKSEEREV